mgnify:CR=1 FL=1
MNSHLSQIPILIKKCEVNYAPCGLGPIKSIFIEDYSCIHTRLSENSISLQDLLITNHSFGTKTKFYDKPMHIMGMDVILLHTMTLFIFALNHSIFELEKSIRTIPENAFFTP